MELSVAEHAIPISILTLHGRLDTASAPELRTRLEGILAGGTVRLVVDLSSVSFMDSAGLAGLVWALKQARLRGGDVKLVEPTAPAVWRVLQLTLFDRVFDIAQSADQARARFTSDHGDHTRR